MQSRRITQGQGEVIREAAADYRAAIKAGRSVDVVDIACETANFWWARLDDRGTRIALRYISMCAQVEAAV